MAQAVTHFLFAALLVALFRDKYLKTRDRKHFPVHYLFVAGVGGVLPDIDFFALMILQNFGFIYEEVHRGITHTLLFVVAFLVLALLFQHIKNFQFGKRHKMKLNVICYILAFGVLTHLLLDMVFGGMMEILYPFSTWTTTFNIVHLLPQSIGGNAIALLDGIFLVLWILYLEMKHRISDYI